jgi:hypothetical protein
MSTLPIPGNVEKALIELGIEIMDAKDDEIIGRCPAHFDRLGKNDSHPSWSVVREDRVDSSGRITYAGTHNCFGGETRVITYNGVEEIQSLSGKTVKLLSSKGWIDAPVKSFGNQQLYEIILSRNGVKKSIRATAGHRWFIKQNGRKQERLTSELIPNHRLSHKLSHGSHNLSVSPWGVAHGITYGDGCLVSGGTSRVCLWGEKDSSLYKYFPLLPESAVISEGGITGKAYSGLPSFFKTLPSLDSGASYLYGWLAGYFAADGCVSDTGNCTLHCANRETLEYVKDLCTRIGIGTYGITSQTRLGLGKEPSLIYKFTFVRSTLTEKFFLINEHKERWAKFNSVKERISWTVVSVLPTDKIEEVFCAVVPDSHDFTLEDNILTGNCFSCGFKGPFVGLVRYILKCDAGTAEEWVRDRGGLERAKYILERKTRKVIDTTEQVNEASLALFTDVPKFYLEKKQLRAFSSRYYGLLWDPQSKALIVPIRDSNGKLMGWQRKKEYSFRNLPKHVQKGTTLFGLHKLSGTTGYIVESPVDAVRLHSVGIYGGLSTFGSEVTDLQLEILADRLDTLYICMDNDEAGIKAAWKIKKYLLGRLTLRFLDYDYIPGKDPGEDSVTDNDIRLGIKNYIPAALARMR